MKRALFWIIQLTWGLPQTVAGFAVFLANVRKPHAAFHGAVVTPWKWRGSVSLGPFIFVSDSLGNVWGPRTVVHEYGHCIQSLIFGPAYLIVFGIPSFIWGEMPALQRRRATLKKPYFSFYTERFANYLGTRATGLPALQGR